MVAEQIDRLVHLDEKYKHLNPVTLELMVLVIPEDPLQEPQVVPLELRQVEVEQEVLEELLQSLQPQEVQRAELVKLLIFQDLAWLMLEAVEVVDLLQ